MSSNQQALLHGGASSAPPVATCVADPYYDTPTDPYWANVTLLLHCEGSDGSTSVVDSSSYADNKTATTYQAISTTKAKFGSASLKVFSANALGMVWQASRFARALGQAVTYEGWFSKVVGTARTVAPFIFRSQGDSVVNFDISQFSTGNNFTLIVNGVNQGNFSYTPDADGFTYWAFCVDTSDNYAFYIQGVQRFTGTSYQATGLNPRVYVGGWTSEINYPIETYIDEVRVTSGVARYTATFTPPTAAFPTYATVADSAHTVLSLHGEAIVDSSSEPKTLTNSGVTVSSAESQFGTGALSFVGASSQYLACGGYSDYTMAGDFTFEFWAKEASGNNCWWSTATANTPYFYNGEVKNIRGAGVHLSYGSATISVWTQFLIARASGVVYVFRDGVLVSSGAYAGTLDFSGLELGRYKPGTNLYLTGYIDDLRITRGVARETTAFTPPALTFCDSETTTYTGQVDGSGPVSGQALTSAQGTLTVANPWVKLSGTQLTASPGAVSATLPNKTAALTGTSATVSQGTTQTSNRTVSLIGSMVYVRDNARLYIPPYPDFTRVPTPTSFGITVRAEVLSTDAGAYIAQARLNLNADGSLSITVTTGTQIAATNYPTVWLYNSFPNGYNIPDVANAYRLLDIKNVLAGAGLAPFRNTKAMNNGTDMAAGGYWEVVFVVPNTSPTTSKTEIITTGPLTINPRYGEFNYYGIFYFTITVVAP